MNYKAPIRNRALIEDAYQKGYQKAKNDIQYINLNECSQCNPNKQKNEQSINGGFVPRINVQADRVKRGGYRSGGAGQLPQRPFNPNSPGEMPMDPYTYWMNNVYDAAVACNGSVTCLNELPGVVCDGNGCTVNFSYNGYRWNGPDWPPGIPDPPPGYPL